MSSKGQIVVPKRFREELGIQTGSNFVMFGKNDILVLKRLNTPSPNEVFEKIHSWGVQKAKEKQWKEDDVMGRIQATRKSKAKKDRG
jgi:AbrB family looped-hinge helix DNA binding protein